MQSQREQLPIAQNDRSAHIKNIIKYIGEKNWFEVSIALNQYQYEQDDDVISIFTALLNALDVEVRKTDWELQKAIYNYLAVLITKCFNIIADHNDRLLHLLLRSFNTLSPVAQENLKSYLQAYPALLQNQISMTNADGKTPFDLLPDSEKSMLPWRLYDVSEATQKKRRESIDRLVVKTISSNGDLKAKEHIVKCIVEHEENKLWLESSTSSELFEKPLENIMGMLLSRKLIANPTLTPYQIHVDPKDFLFGEIDSNYKRDIITRYFVLIAPGVIGQLKNLATILKVFMHEKDEQGNTLLHQAFLTPIIDNSTLTAMQENRSLFADEIFAIENNNGKTPFDLLTVKQKKLFPASRPAWDAALSDDERIALHGKLTISINKTLIRFATVDCFGSKKYLEQIIANSRTLDTDDKVIFFLIETYNHLLNDPSIVAIFCGFLIETPRSVTTDRIKTALGIEGKSTEIEALLRKILASDPNQVRALYNLAMLKHILEIERVDLLRRVIKIAPHYRKAILKLADYYLKDIPAEASDFPNNVIPATTNEKLAALYRWDKTIHLNHNISFHNLGALYEKEEIIVVDSDFPNGTPNTPFERAATLYRHSLKINPKYIDSIWRLARLHQSGRIKVIDSDFPNDKPIPTSAAERAAALYRQILQIDPKNRTASTSLCELISGSLIQRQPEDINILSSVLICNADQLPIAEKTRAFQSLLQTFGANNSPDVRTGPPASHPGLVVATPKSAPKKAAPKLTPPSARAKSTTSARLSLVLPKQPPRATLPKSAPSAPAPISAPAKQTPALFSQVEDAVEITGFGFNVEETQTSEEADLFIKMIKKENEEKEDTTSQPPTKRMRH